MSTIVWFLFVLDFVSCAVGLDPALFGIMHTLRLQLRAGREIDVCHNFVVHIRRKL